MKKGAFFTALAMTLIWILPAMAELRPIHRASQIGGTGMLFQRVGDQLDPKEMNASIFVDYLNYDDDMPLNPSRTGDEPFIEDPRGDGEIWAILTYNYGINHIVELGAQVPLVFGSDLRDEGVGRIGVDVRFLILNKSRMGGGISSTIWLNAPSFQDDNSSDEVNGGFELNFMLEGKSFTNYLGWDLFDRVFLEKMTSYATLGWGYDDYLYFEKVDPYPYNAGRWISRDPESPEFDAAEFICASYGVEYEIYDRLFLGAELLAKQYPNKYHNDNNVTIIFPEISYTYNDRFTVQGAFGFTGIRTSEDDQPELIGKLAFTYHFPEFYRAPKTERVTPGSPQDIYDIFVPSRKPVPIQTEEEEEILLDEEGGE